MADASWNKIDKEKFDFEEVYCGFIDILGYKEKSDSFFNGKLNLLGRINRAMNTTKSTMDFTALMTPHIPRTDVVVSILSDSIILKTDANGQNALSSLLHYASVLSTYLSYEELFVRGGVSKGYHFETSTELGFPFISSKALSRAYILESQKAINPRILVEPSIVNEMIESDKAFLVKEKDDFFIQYANNAINADGNEKNIEEVFAEMKDIEKQRDSTSLQRAKDKLQWVLDYYYWYLCINKLDTRKGFKQFWSGINRGFSLYQ